MSSMGISCARVYVMKKKAEEKLQQRIEQDRSGRRDDSVKPSNSAHHGGAVAGKSTSKVHPGAVFGVPVSSTNS